MAKHSDIMTIFRQMFMDAVAVKNEVDCYWPCGRDTVRIRLSNKTEYVFRYSGLNNWSLETIDSFLEKLSEKRKVLH